MNPPRTFRKQQDRALPHNPETERALLGGLLISPAIIEEVQTGLAVEDFAVPRHQHLYRMLLDLRAAGHHPDVVLVLDEADRRNTTEMLGGVQYVVALPDACPSVASIPTYATRIRDYAVRRRLLLASIGIQEAVKDGSTDTNALIDQAESAIGAVSRSTTEKDWSNASDAVARFMAQLAQRAANPGELTGVATGFHDLDRLLTGWQRGEVTVLAARPAQGKTALALNMAAAAARTGVGVGVFSLEMVTDELIGRLVTAEARVDATRVRTGQIDPNDDWPRLGSAADRVANLPLWIEDTSGLSLAQLRVKARRLKAKHPTLGLLIVDYLQLMQGDGQNRQENRENVVAAISRGLKVLAKELDLPIIVISQLNRQVEARQEKRPMMSDLRESGSIEQDADNILFLYRDETYHPDSEHKGTAEVIVAKQRKGATGMVRLAFLPQYTLFQNLAGSQRDYQ